MDLAVIGAQPRRLGAHVVISSMPLPRLIRMTSGLTDDSYGAASLLRSSTLYVIGFGMRGPVPPELEDITWWYDPDPHTPYHRVTVLSQQAPGLAPEGCWSLMAEVCETEYKPIPAKLVQQCAQALQRWVDPESIISTWEWRFPIAYPTPMFNRDQALAVIHPELERHRIFSVGRFGGWRYEMGNMDQCFQQGVDVVDRLLEVVA
jgi:protoporphyrinogen oxidase